MPTSTRLHQLADHGQSVWIDFLSRDLLRSGELARLTREDAVTGVTSNPTIFAKALSGGDAYDEQIAASEGDARSVFLALAMRDVSEACDLLRPVWERTLVSGARHRPTAQCGREAPLGPFLVLALDRFTDDNTRTVSTTLAVR